MERLTKRDVNGIAYIEHGHCEAAANMLAVGRLADYEDAEEAGRVLPPTVDEDYDGLKIKYRVYKARNNTPVEDCFVLRPDKDPAARSALMCYADDCGNEQLRRDIYEWIDNMMNRATQQTPQAPY